MEWEEGVVIHLQRDGDIRQYGGQLPTIRKYYGNLRDFSSRKRQVRYQGAHAFLESQNKTFIMPL